MHENRGKFVTEINVSVVTLHLVLIRFLLSLIEQPTNEKNSSGKTIEKEYIYDRN